MRPGKIKYSPQKDKKIETGFFETLMRGRHFSFLSVSTRFGKKEVLARNNEQYFACKVLPLIINDDAELPLIENQKCTLKEFCKIITDSKIKNNLRVPIFSVARPITKFYEKYYSSLDIYELPGGVVENKEDFELGGVRELIEELGLSKDQILAHTVLLDPCPFDSGSHVECIGIVAVLISGTIKPVNWESIRGEQTKVISFQELETFINTAKSEKKMLEGYIEYAYLLIKEALRKNGSVLL